MSPSRHTTAIGWLLAVGAALWALPAAADDVVLHNGNTFDGVIVVAESAEQVRIRLAFGEMSLPRSWVARIERAASPLAEYLERRRALRSRPDAEVDDWIDLALWARDEGLKHGYREALLAASLIEPRHPRLAPLLRGIGYVLEEPTGLWVSVAELRRAEAAREAQQRAAEERARRADAGSDGGRATTEETLSRAIEALALAELEREARTSRREAREERTFHPLQIGAYAGPYYPYYPGLVTVPAPGAGTAGPPPAEAKDPYAAVRDRLPGSLLSNRGRMGSRSRPHLPGSLLSARSQ